MTSGEITSVGTAGAAPEHVAGRGAWFKKLPVVHQVRQSVGLQRGMLIAGLVLTAVFVASVFVEGGLTPGETPRDVALIALNTLPLLAEAC